MSCELLQRTLKPAPEKSGLSRVIPCRVGENWFCFDASQVISARQIVAPGETAAATEAAADATRVSSKILHLSDLVEGDAHLRGPGRYAVVFRSGTGTLELVADDVSGVVTVTPEQSRPLPALLARYASPALVDIVFIRPSRSHPGRSDAPRATPVSREPADWRGGPTLAGDPPIAADSVPTFRLSIAALLAGNVAGPSPASLSDPGAAADAAADTAAEPTRACQKGACQNAAAPREPSRGARRPHLLLFRPVGDRGSGGPLCCLSLTQITEICEPLKIVRVPTASRAVEGLVVWRRQPVPVLNLGALLARPAAPEHARWRLLITRSNRGDLLAFSVHPQVAIVPPPAGAVAERLPLASHPFVRGTFRCHDGLTLAVLNLERLAAGQ